MSGTETYDEDFFAWSQHQANVLRSLVRSRRALPNELDLGHIAEEIEDLGRSELRAVESYIRLILSHLAKAASDPAAEPVAHWRTEVTTWQHDLLDAFTPAMAAKIDLQKTWRRALREAEALVSSARAYCLAVLGDIMATTRAGEEPSMRQRADLRLSVFNAHAAAVEAVNLMYHVGGGTSAYAASPLDRLLRDAHTINQHLVAAPKWPETAGRVYLGLDSGVPLL